MNNKELLVLMEVKERIKNPSIESEKIARMNGWVDADYLSLEKSIPAGYRQFVPTEKAQRLIKFRDSFELFWGARQETYAASKVLMSLKTMTFIIESLTSEEYSNFVAAKTGESATLYGYSVYRTNDIQDNAFIFF